VPFVTVLVPGELPRRVEVVGPVQVGRGHHNEIRVLDPTVSAGSHARIVRDGDAWYVEDLGASGGTRVGDAPISRHRLGDGDEVRIGATRLLWHVERGGNRDESAD
jgi:adenylate cyclase